MRAWAEALLDLIYPGIEVPAHLARLESPFCARCGEPFDASVTAEFICSNCRDRQWHISEARAAYRADGFVREVIHEFKYNGQFHHLGLLTDWMKEGFQQHYAHRQEKFEAMVPVPLHALRWRYRGFNQAYELGRKLSRKINLPLMDCLKRVKNTETQTHLSREERLRNLAGAFEVKRGFDVQGKRLLVLDDVFTTGASVDSCASVLLRAGAAEVCALTVARG